MPLPSKPTNTDEQKRCISETIRIEKAAGRPHDQAVAIALNHCKIVSSDEAAAYAAAEAFEAESAKLNTEQRKNLPANDFACPATRQLPIHDAAHVRNAMARFNQTDFSKCDKAAAKARIMRAAKQFGIDTTNFK